MQAPFKVWAPLADAPDSFVYFTPGKKPQLLIHQPVDYWHKSPDLPRCLLDREFDIVSCADRAAARAALPKDLSRTAFIGAPFPELRRLGSGAINPEHCIAQLDYARAAKTPYEFACLREANVLGARGHLAAESAFRAGASEFEIALEFMKACGLREQELPYNPIVALNEHGAVLHYQFQERARRRNRIRCSSTPAPSSRGYASDITRTLFASTMPSSPGSSAVRRAATRSCARRCAPASTGGISTRPRIAPSASSCARPASSR